MSRHYIPLVNPYMYMTLLQPKAHQPQKGRGHVTYSVNDKIQLFLVTPIAMVKLKGMQSTSNPEIKLTFA